MYYTTIAEKQIYTNQGNLIHDILNFAEESGYRSFSIRQFCEKRLQKDLSQQRKVQKTVKHLCFRNQLIQLWDDRLISSKKMDEIKAKIRAHISSNGGLTIRESKEILGQGRMRGIPILDYLDEIGFTVRVGKIRVLRKNFCTGV